MRGELSRLRGVEEEARSKSNQVSSLQEELQKLRKELSATQQEKKTIEDWAQTYRDEMEKVSQPAGPGARDLLRPPASLCAAPAVQSLSCWQRHRDISMAILQLKGQFGGPLVVFGKFEFFEIRVRSQRITPPRSCPPVDQVPSATSHLASQSRMGGSG